MAQAVASPARSLPTGVVQESVKEPRIKHLLQVPALTFYFLFAIFPLIFTLYLSVNNWQISGQHNFIGLQNYVQLVQDQEFLTSLRNTAIFVIGPVTIEYICGMTLALLVLRLTRGRNLLRLCFLVPMMLAPLIVGIIWKMMFDETYGPLNDILARLALPPVAWVTDPVVAVGSIIISDVWEWTPLMFLILFAAMQSLPTEVFESARVDGASAWRVFWDMMFPLLVPASITVVLIRSIESFKIFDVIFLITGGGPGTATESATLYAYNVGLRSGNLGYAAAMTVVMLILVIVLATVLLNGLRITMAHRTARATRAEQLRAVLEQERGTARELVHQEKLVTPQERRGIPQVLLRLIVPLRYVVLVVWILFALFPIYWMVTTAFKTHLQVYNGPFYIPGVDYHPYLGSWQYVFSGDVAASVIRAIFNSVLYATAGALLAVIVGALAGYGLARYQYRYGPLKNDDLGFLYLSQRVMPPIVAVLALFVAYRVVHLLDTQVGMILIYTWVNIPITAYLLKDFFAGIPRDLEYAAAVDGYGKLQQIVKVVVPLARPGLAAAFLLSFFFAWNDFLLALILTFQKGITLPIVITSLNQRMEPEWGFLSALGIVAIVPPIIATLILDRILGSGGLFRGAR